MSFSGKVKEELSRQESPARHCRIAEIAAILSLCGSVCGGADGKYFVKITTENLTVARKYYILVKDTFHASVEASARRSRGRRRSRAYTVLVRDAADCRRILEAAKLLDEGGRALGEGIPVSPMVVRNACCKRAFLRGAFLACGSMSDPSKAYHFEIVAPARAAAEQLQGLIGFFGIEAKIVIRKGHHVVYVKEGSQIVDLLNVMGAHVALMDLENVRILKEMRNSINRQVNCETANITKTVNAASKQAEDIRYIRDVMGLGELSEGLEEMARARLEHPEASLKELGAFLSPPIGKSGVNHRLRKLGEIADGLREEKEREENGNEEDDHQDTDRPGGQARRALGPGGKPV